MGMAIKVKNFPWANVQYTTSPVPVKEGPYFQKKIQSFLESAITHSQITRQNFGYSYNCVATFIPLIV